MMMMMMMRRRMMMMKVFCQCDFIVICSFAKLENMMLKDQKGSARMSCVHKSWLLAGSFQGKVLYPITSIPGSSRSSLVHLSPKRCFIHVNPMVAFPLIVTVALGWSNLQNFILAKPSKLSQNTVPYTQKVTFILKKLWTILTSYKNYCK